MLTSQFVAKFLRARGVDRIFGTPGSDTINLIQAFAEEGVEYVLTHHENTAAYMAAAYGELRRVPGVVLVTKGPGITNLASGIAAAHLDRRPVIVISAIISPDILEKNPHQDVPLIAFGNLIAKLSEEMTHENAAELLPRAYRTAISPRPGAVYVPVSPLESKSELSLSDAEATAIIAADVAADKAPVPDIAAAAELLRKAR
jgi:acetolactate synthase-1/2/3 large subunit